MQTMFECFCRHAARPSVILAVLFAGRLAGAQDSASWPQFHGPNRDNRSTETGLMREWPEEGPSMLWAAHDLGHGYASVAIAGGRILTAGNVEGKTVVTALDMKGNRLWIAENGEAWGKPYPGTRGTPTIDGDRVYHESPHGDVVCLEAATGKTQWSLNILKMFGGSNIHWGLAESVLIDGDHVICSPGGPDASVVALDKSSGDVVWKAKGTGHPAGYASPVLATWDGLRLIMTLTLKDLIGVNADTGELLFQISHVSFADENILPPIYDDGHVIVSSLKVGTIKWKLKRAADGVVSLAEIWRSEELDHHHGGMVLHDGFLYASGAFYNYGAWVCLNAETGAKTYVDMGVGKGCLTYADGMLYTLSERGTVGLVPAVPQAHTIVGRFVLPPGDKGMSWAHPVVCGKRLYIRHGADLYAYDIAAPATP